MNNDDSDALTAEGIKKWSLLSGVFGLVVYVVSQVYFTPNKAGLCAVFAAMLVFSIRNYWKLKYEIWFWALIVIIFAADLAVVLFFPEGRWPNATIILAPIAAVQLAINIFMISTVDAAIRKRKAPK
jgi:hypothetical protein